MSKADPHTLVTSSGAILVDAGLATQVGAEWFEPDWWSQQGLLQPVPGGRGGVGRLFTTSGDLVLRHYRRGGAVARLLGERYLWTGQSHCRSFTEFRLLDTIYRRNLPVPQPIAARYVRHGAVYTADLITRFLPGAKTLAEHILDERCSLADFANIGRTVARFHASGVYHADLNAHNILYNENRVYLIDFDRGRMRNPSGSWQQANLARLKRSLLKLLALVGTPAEQLQPCWNELQASYWIEMERP